jgi:hypothetical protein
VPEAVVVDIAAGTPEALELTLRFEDALADELAERSMGVVDGDEAGATGVRVYLYGPDLDAIAGLAQSVLASDPYSHLKALILIR